MADKGLAIYVHVPFCVKKCAYCDFLSFPAGEGMVSEYFAAVEREIRSVGSEAHEAVRSVYFGGGTPSLADPGQLYRILSLLSSRFHFSEDVEISMECNPCTVDPQRLRAFKEAGFNRMSVGAQSFDDAELGLLGRIHCAKDAARCVLMAKEAGFANVNIDLIGGIPGQDRSALMSNVERALGLEPEHISLYGLIVEPGTPFFEKYGAGRANAPYPPLPDEDEERDMMHEAFDALVEAGFEHYEISNFCKPGFACRQNLTYWMRGDYLGFGLGAASLRSGVRFRNTSEMDVYLSGADVREDFCALTREQEMEEFMFLGLRLIDGVSEDDFEETFGVLMDEVYGGELRKLLSEGLLKRRGGKIGLTRRGEDLANFVWSHFLLTPSE